MLRIISSYEIKCLFYLFLDSFGGSFLGALSESLEGVKVVLLLVVGELPSLLLYFLDDSLSSESVGGDESLDLRSLDVDLAGLGGDLSLRSELGDHESDGLSLLSVALLLVIDLDETELLEDVIGSFGAESLGEGGTFLGEAGDGLGADLDNLDVQNSDIGGDNASSD